MARTTEINLKFGQDGTRIETEQDPFSDSPKALTNAPDGALKHGLNVDWHGGLNLWRRLGYQDAFHDPRDGTRIVHQIWDAAGAVVTDRLWQAVMDATNGVKSLGRYTYMDNRQTKATHGYDLDRYTLFSTRDENERYIMLYINPAAPLTIGPDVNSIITDNPATGDEAIVLAFSIADQWIFIYDITVGGGGWAVASDIADPAAVMRPANPVISVRNVIGISHTLHWRNPGTPYIRQLEIAPLDRNVFDIVDGDGNYCFSDTNIRGCEGGRLRNYEMWGRGGERETYSLDTYGGHYVAPPFAAVPRMWNCGVAGNQPPAGSFDVPYVNPYAVQRRVQIWFPEWYHWWCEQNGYPTGGGAEEIGMNYTFAPFIWYHKPYDPARNIALYVSLLHTAPIAGDTLTQAVTGATMLVTDVVQSDNKILLGFLDITVNAVVDEILTQAVTGATMRVEYSTTLGEYVSGIDLKTGFWDGGFDVTGPTFETFPDPAPPSLRAYQQLELKLQSITTAPVMGDTITQAITGASLVVESVDIDANIITGFDLNTAGWNTTDTVTSDNVGGVVFAPSPGTVLLAYPYTESVIYGVVVGVVDWEFPTATTVSSDNAGGVVMEPFVLVLTNLEHFDHDQFYAEPCGRFMVKYKDSLFMARIERTYLKGAGYQQPGTPTWTYEPSAYMWSFYGLATGMELGTPPVHPFRVPNEPNERVWGCQAHGGFQLNRHNLFKPADGLAITGLCTWNDSLYIMKPTGFGQIWGSYSGNFQLRDLEMSQGPCGAYAWCKADEGIYYVTKKGLYLFDGNSASQNVCLSDLAGVGKIFKDDIDWGSCADMLTGEIIGVVLTWDKKNRQVLISYPKVGEQGAGTGAVEGKDLPDGTPTRMLVYDTLQRRFSEWVLPLPIDDEYRSPCPGIMLAGKDPTDDDYLMITHPIGNYLGGNSNGQLLSRANIGHRDNVEIDGSAVPEPLSGSRITYDATSKDHTLGVLKSKLTVTTQRQIIYTNNGRIKRRVIYNFYNENEEEELVFGADADGYYSEKQLIQTMVTAGTDSGLSLISFKYYHDDDVHTALRIELVGMTTAPTIGDTLTQAVTGATLLVSSTDIDNDYIWGQDLGTGVGWDIVAGHTVSGGTLAPDTLVPVALDIVINPENTNPDNEPIQWVAVSVEVAGTQGYSKVSD